MAEPGPPKSSYAHLEGAGKLASRIEPRAASQPPSIARTAPRNPKAPLPPRVSQADKGEVVPAPTSGIIDTIEPESVHTKVPTPAPKAPAAVLPAGKLLEDDEPEMPTAALMPKDFQKALEQLQRRREASNSVVPPPPPASSSRAVDFESALAQLQRQRETGAPAPPPPPSSGRASSAPRPKMGSIPSVKDLGKDLKPLSVPPPPASEPASGQPATKSITAPLSNLGLKPGSGTPLSPLRTPSPLAIVSGASLRLSMPEKTSPMAQGPLQPPPAAESSPLALPFPAPSKSVPPPPLSSRPPGARKSFPAPPGGPGAAYERAFRQWSSPAIVPIDDPPTGEPVTFQVYTAEDVATGRRPMRSMGAVPVQPKKSLGVKIGLGLLGAVIVALTAAAVIAVSTDEPKRTTTASSAASAAVEEPPAAPSIPLTPIPSTITIGDPVDEIEDTTSAPTATKTSTPASTATAAAKPKPKVTPAPPSSLKGIAPPPNPYGN